MAGPLPVSAELTRICKLLELGCGAASLPTHVILGTESVSGATFTAGPLPVSAWSMRISPPRNGKCVLYICLPARFRAVRCSYPIATLLRIH